MLTKICLFFKIQKFYKIFGFAVGESFITKLSDMTADNVYDVLFDLNEIHSVYDMDCDVDAMEAWLTKLKHQILNYCEGGVK